MVYEINRKQIKREDMKRFVCMLVLAGLSFGAFAQTDGVETNSTLKELEEVTQSKQYITVSQ